MSILTKPSSPSFSKALQIKQYLLQLQADKASPSSSTHLKRLHARLLCLGLHHDNYLLNTFLRCSFHLGLTHYSRLLFSQAAHPNIFLWNTMIRGLVSKDCFYDAVPLYHSMRRQGFLPNNFTLPFLFKASANLMDFHLGLTTHGLAVKAGFDSDVSVKTSLVSFYAKCGYMDHALRVFDDIPHKNIVSWTAIICGYIGLGKCREAVDVFRRLLEMGVRPDSYTLVRVLSACTQLGDLTNGEWINKYMDDIGMEKNVFVATALLDLYTKCGDMEKAQLIFNGMREKDVISWTTMIHGYASNGLPKYALDIFFQMQRENLKPDRYAVVGVLSACAQLGALELGEWTSRLLDINEFLCSPVLGTTLIDMYAKCGRITRAWQVFKAMKEKDIVVWNAAIHGLAMNGHVKSALGLFGQVEKSGTQPDEKTFIGLLCGCTHAGLVDEGRKFFNSMHHVFFLTPTIEHYGCMVDLLGRAGLLDEAHKLIRSMPMEANAVVWGALLSGCRLHKDTQLAEHILKQLIKLEPWNTGNYVLLSNIYSANHKWDEAEKLRSRMREKGMQKVRACSWIEVGGVVHEFLVGDKNHPLSEKIYAKLEELNKAMKAAGYVPTTDFVLFDIEEEEKEHT